MNRRLLPCVGCWMLVLAADGAASEAIPSSPPPPPVMFEHLPDRLHAYVWRNWDLVPTATIARVVAATEEQIESLAASLGLPPNRPVPDHLQRQVYITVVRRNWHLLPVEQLLDLIGMTPAEFAFHLREDDVFLIKLGGTKPACEPLRYEAVADATRERAAEVRRTVQRHFGDRLATPGEERLAFIGRLRGSSDHAPAPPPAPSDDVRFIYSYFGAFGDPLADAAVDPYPDGLLEKLSAAGVTGVWLHVVLRQLAPGGDDFPEFGAGHERRLENLRSMVARAARHGIRVFLYINEPRAQPEAFFEGRPEMAGIREGDHLAMCTADPRVLGWVRDALTHVFREVPGLGGVFTITASENLTSCASHFRHAECPRCAARSEAEIIADVNAAIEAGVHRAAPDATVLCWDWGWARHAVAPEHIARMPANTWLLSVSEWSQPFTRGGVPGTVGEYAMSVVGPGPRAATHWKLARERGLRTAARVSFNSTWELSSVPYLPVLDLVAEHAANLARADVDGLMLSWSLGGYPSPNLALANRMIGDRDLDPETALDDLARRHFGPGAAPHLRRAWRALSEGFREFPYGLGLYTAPQQLGPANLLYRTPTGSAATMTCYPYDDLASWRGQYAPEILAGQFAKVAAGWNAGLEHYDAAVRDADPAHRAAVEDERSIARAAATYWPSVANQVRFIHERDELARADSAERRGRMIDLLDDEIVQAIRLFEAARQDSRIGFEAANHYFYMPLDLVEKVVNCEHLKQQLAPR